jgi:diaminopimelate epimerase
MENTKHILPAVTAGNTPNVSPVIKKARQLQFSVFRPAGNDTGLFSGIIRDTEQRKAIADALQRTYLNVEQVGFVNLDPNNAELMMTGGEFCGNATSSAAYHILNGQPGSISIKVSGVKEKLLAGVSEAGEGFSQMPVYSDPSYLKPDLDRPGNVLVVMEGISHYIDFDAYQIKGLSVEQIKAKAREEMRQKGIDQNPACGIIYAEELKHGWVIHPIIYVRDADTLFYETSCGSGTTALGLVVAHRAGETMHEIPVIQPSGLTIKVCVEFENGVFGYVQIQSFVQKVQEGVLEVEKDPQGMRHLQVFQTNSKLQIPQIQLPKFFQHKHSNLALQLNTIAH